MMIGIRGKWWGLSLLPPVPLRSDEFGRHGEFPAPAGCSGFPQARKASRNILRKHSSQSPFPGFRPSPNSHIRTRRGLFVGSMPAEGLFYVLLAVCQMARIRCRDDAASTCLCAVLLLKLEVACEADCCTRPACCLAGRVEKLLVYPPPYLQLPPEARRSQRGDEYDQLTCRLAGWTLFLQTLANSDVLRT
ncbi:hypothetical protein IWX90DRAFT_128237 [Phyllosticta citrichinensis]|uniref:Secreted protein n=1 Tax=Phyllosticta citrichinensis TaxID=1130410 RepID=A0ABR1Y460_9PEZI